VPITGTGRASSKCRHHGPSPATPSCRQRIQSADPGEPLDAFGNVAEFYGTISLSLASGLRTQRWSGPSRVSSPEDSQLCQRDPSHPGRGKLRAVGRVQWVVAGIEPDVHSRHKTVIRPVSTLCSPSVVPCPLARTVGKPRGPRRHLTFVAEPVLRLERSAGRGRGVTSD